MYIRLNVTDLSPSSRAVVMKGQSYNSTPPMSRTVCTEPQGLYKGALYFFSYIRLNVHFIL